MDSFRQKTTEIGPAANKLLTAYDRSRISLYLQVASVLRERIYAGQWKPGDKIATLDELEGEFHVARVTVRQAVEVLREEGLLQTQQGRGTYVATKPRERHFFKLANDWKSLIESLKDNVPRRFSIGKTEEKPKLAATEGNVADSYVRLESVQDRAGEPYSSVNVLLASHIFEKAPLRFKTAAALVVLDDLEGLVLRDAYQTLTVGSADPRMADMLKVQIGAPVVNTLFIVVDDEGTAIYVGDITYRSDSIQMKVNLLAGTKQAGSSADVKLKRSGA